MPRGIPKNPRFKKATAGGIVNAALANIGGLPTEKELATLNAVLTQDGPELVREEFALPRGWAKGALLNVRNTGAEYRITLFPEEFDPQQPERCLRFTNPAECQNFVSRWYSRESHDPRAR